MKVNSRLKHILLSLKLVDCTWWRRFDLKPEDRGMKTVFQSLCVTARMQGAITAILLSSFIIFIL